MVRRPKFETLEGRQMLASDWQNPARVRDVNNDHAITPLDALLGINRINQQPGQLPARETNSSEPYYDVNGDGSASPIDVLIVVNTLIGGLLVDVALANDTGVGPDAGHDALTNDYSIRGYVQGEPDFIQLRLNASGAWQDVPGGPDVLGNFSIPATTIDNLFGGPLADGDYALEVRAGYADASIELVDRNVVQWRLDRTPPTSRFIGEILVDDPSAIVIPLSEQVTSQSLKAASINLYDISWGERPVGSPWGVDGNHPGFKLEPLSVTLSPSGRELVIQPPAIDRSVKYLVSIDAAVQDAAGNQFDVDGATSTLTARANYFALNPQLQFDTTYSFRSELDAKITEFGIKVDSDDVLIWSGDQSVANTSRYELYDAHGTLLHVLTPSTISGPGTAAQPAFWPVVAGDYHLRKIDPPLGAGSFRLYRASQLPTLSTTHVVTESDNWPIDFYKADLSAGDSVYFESLSVNRTLTTVFNPLGERTALTVPQGNDQILDAELSGTYIFAAWRIDFKSYRSSRASVEQASNGAFDGQLSIPGQRQQIIFETTPGEVYSIDAKDSQPGVDLKVDVPRIDDIEWVFVARQSSITVTASRIAAGTTPLAYQLRLTKLSTSPALPLNSSLDSPAFDSTKYYIGSSRSSGEQMLLDGDQAYMLIDFDDAGRLVTQQGDGPLVVSRLDENYLVRVKAVRSSLPWVARTVQTISGSLGLDQLTTLNFPHGYERFELTITARQDEILTLGNLTRQPAQVLDIAVLDASNAPARSLSSEWPGTNFQFSRPGTYRLVVSGLGASSRGTVSFHASASDSWPDLPVGVTQSMGRSEQLRFKLAAGLERLYLHTTSARDNSAWIVVNQRGDVVKRFEIREGVTSNDLDLALSRFDQHFLIATTDDNSLRGPLEFVSLRALTESKQGLLVQPSSGQLSGLGDRVVVRYDLQRGQRVQLTSLGIDPAAVTFQWNNSAGALNLNQPWLVPASMTYELVLTNHSQSVQAYAINLALAPSPVLGRGISGFGVVRSGVVTNTAYSFIPFEVEAGAMFMLDWQLGDASVEAAIVAPGGDVVQTLLYSDSGLIRAETSGVYFVRLLAFFENSQPFRFVMHDLSTSTTIGLGQVLSGQLAPFESRLLQLPLASVTDLLSPADSQTGVRVQLQSSLPGGQSGTLFAAAPVAVLVVNESTNTAPISVVIQPVSSLETLELDVPKSIQLSPGEMAAFRFATNEPNVEIGLRFSVPVAAVQVIGALGDVLPGTDGLYHLSYAGEYRLVIVMPSDGDRQLVNVELASPVRSSVDYTLGSTVSGTLVSKGSERRYAFTLAAGGHVLFGFSGIGGLDVHLKSAEGRLLDLTTESDWRLPSIQYLGSGSYVLSIVAPRDQFAYSLYLQSLSGATLVQPSDYQGQLTDQDLFRLFRYESAQPEQVIWFNYSDQPQLVQLITASGRQAFNGEMLHVDSTHPLLVIVQGPSTAYRFSLSKPIRTEYDLPMGQTIDRVVSSPAETQMATLQVASASVAIEFASGDASAVLVKPDGARVQLPSQVSIFTALVAGLYKIEISSRRSGVTYSLKATSLDGVASIAIGSFAELVPGNYYRVDLARAELLRSRLIDGDNRALALSWLQAWNHAGQSISLEELTGLDQGNYWLRFNSPAGAAGPFQLRLKPSGSIAVVSQLDERTGIVLDDRIAEARVQIPVSAGGLLALADFALAAESRGAYRFIPASGNLSDVTPWQEIASFPPVWIVSQSGTVEFEFRGSGSSVVRLTNLRQSPSLIAGQEQTVRLEPATRIQGWRMPIDRGGALQFNRLESTENLAAWYLVDSSGLLHRLPGVGKVFSAVSPAPLYLIALLPNHPLAVNLAVRVE